jgi:hypothetical protein
MKESSNLPVAKCGLGLLLFWATYVFMAIAIWWPDWVAKTFHSRWALAYFALWCLVAGVFCCKSLRTILAQLIRGIRQGISEFSDDFRRGE